MDPEQEPQQAAAAVLVVATDPNIEALVGELVAFAGHKPLFDVAAGAAGESIRRLRPDALLLDLALDPEVVQACFEAAEETGTECVLMSSTASEAELRDQAEARGMLYFALPGGPIPLARVLDKALAHRQKRENLVVASANPSAESVEPSIRAALACIARARLLSPMGDSRQRPRLGVFTLEPRDAIRSHAALRAAVKDYARQLREQALDEEKVVTLVQETVCDCAAVVGADSAVPQILKDSERWARDAISDRA